MRTHFLKQVQLEGSEKFLRYEPNLDLYRANEVRFLHLERSAEPQSFTSVRFGLDYAGERGSFLLVLVCRDVRQLRLPEIQGPFFVTELEIEDVSRKGLEGIRFELVDQFDRGFSCTCGQIVVESFQPN